jgi:Tat protein translocase TatB subunit
MFGLGAPEIVVILLVALVVLGPQKLPELAKHLARFLGDMRRMADDVRQQFDEATTVPPPAAPPPQLEVPEEAVARQAPKAPPAAPPAAPRPTDPTVPPPAADV